MSKHEERMAARRAYRDAWQAKADELRAELEAEFPSIPEAVRDDVWNHAYAEGHSGGLNEIDMYYRDIAPIIEKTVKAVKEGMK